MGELGKQQRGPRNRETDVSCAPQGRPATLVHMFDTWARELLGYRTLHDVDRRAWINTARAFPPAGTRSDQLPLWQKAGGLALEPWMPARQLAWLLRADGTWLALVELQARSGNNKSRICMQLWLLADDISTTDPQTSPVPHERPRRRANP